VVFLYQIFDVGSRAHGSGLATECMKIGKLTLCRHGIQIRLKKNKCL
jgi:hypothetical protein